MTPLDMLIRASLVLAAAWTIATLLRRRPAALRHWILAVGIVGAGVAPAITALAPAWHLPRAAAPSASRPPQSTDRAPQDRPAAAIVIETHPIVPAAPVARRVDLSAIAAWTWAGGAVFGLLVLAAGLARLAWIRVHAEPLVDPLWTEVHDEIARAYGLARRATLWQTDRPLLVTWGVVAPKIIVPRGAAGWPRERIRVVLAHELAHVARGDWLLQIAAEVTRAMYWCNPLAWIVCRRARIESEHACDDAVLRLGITGSEYASHLLDLARSMRTRRRALVPAQAIVRPSSLERRVAAMLNVRLNRSPLSRAGRAAATVAVALVTVFAAGFSAAQGSMLSGTIADQLGGSITGVSVSLVDLTTNANRSTQTDAAGRYEFDGLSSGDYMLTIKTPGFEPIEQRVVVGTSPLQRNAQLTLGMIHESITVVDGASSPMPDAKRAIVQSKQDPAMPEFKSALMQDKTAPGASIPDAKRAMINSKRQDAAAQPCATGSGCILPPVKLTDKKPVYPDAGVSGVVVLRALIDASGHVTNVQPVGSPNADLMQAAINAVSQWEFAPTWLDGQIVDTEMTVTINFKSTK